MVAAAIRLYIERRFFYFSPAAPGGQGVPE
jgi:hypothetical protein